MLHAKMLRYLDEVARCGSIRKAAERFNVASSAVNRQILALEQELGMQIFERMPRGLRLTTAGELLVDHVRKTLKDHDRVSARLDALRGLQQGKVTLATTLGLTVSPLRDVISDFMDRHSRVQIEVRALVADAIPNAVLSGEADLALSYNLAAQPGLRSRLSLEVPVVAVLAPDHPLAGQGRVHLAEAAIYPMVLPLAGMSVRGLIDNAFEKLSISAPPALESNSIELIKHLVAKPPRLTFLNAMDAIVEQRQGRLAFLHLAGGQLTPQTLQLVARSRGALDPMGELFAEQLQGSLAAMVDQIRRDW
jgi:DNA-binding transcriptional LysR family regulator